MLKNCKIRRLTEQGKSPVSVANIRFDIARMIYETYFSDIVRHSFRRSICKMRMHLRKEKPDAELK